MSCTTCSQTSTPSVIGVKKEKTMLYNLLWANGTTAEAPVVVGNPALVKDPFQLSTLISWLETRDPTKPYVYSSTNYCLLAQYFSEHLGTCQVGYKFVYEIEGSGGNHQLPPGFDSIARGIGSVSDHTFGKALARAKAFTE
jgi:hypothetical protein